MRLHDDLLEWCSEQLAGTLTTFRQTFDWLATRDGSEPGASSLALYAMQHLGHLEVDWNAKRWAVAPPVITALDDSGGNALLVGARPRWLMRRLMTLDSDPDEEVQNLALDVTLYDEVEQPSAPSARFLTGPRDEVLAALCAKLDIRFEHRVSLRLRETLPTIDSYLAAGRDASPPPGMEARRLVVSRAPRWVDADDDAPEGAYEYEAYGAPRYQFQDVDGRFEVDKSIATYAELRRVGVQVLYYAASTQTMYSAARTPLPLLAARCAVLRTGLLPRFLPGGNKRIAGPLGAMNAYGNVPLLHYKAICESLGQQVVLLPER